MSKLHARRPRVVAVCGGKGGVGKSTVAANLAVALARLGQRVAIVDADLGAANLHTMLGVVHPTRGISEFLDSGLDSLEDVRTQIGSSPITLVAGTSRPGAANIKHAELVRLVRGINRLDADTVVVDVGAGASYHVVDLVAAADIKLLVLTPNLTSLHNAYAMLKACVHRVVKKLCDGETERAMVDSALAHEGRSRTIAKLVDVLRGIDETGVADRITDTLARFGVSLVGNQVEHHGDAAVLARIGTMIHDHLGIDAPLLATIKHAPALGGSLHAGIGTLARPGDDAHATFRRLATAVLKVDLDHLRGTPRTTAGTMPLWVQRELIATG